MRLNPEDSDKALRQPHVRVFDMTGRPMKGWVLVSPSGVTTDKALHAWIEKSLVFARALPPK